jgi:hypothetical protein
VRKTGQITMKAGASPYDVATEYYRKVANEQECPAHPLSDSRRMSGVVGRGMVVSLKSFVKDLE